MEGNNVYSLRPNQVVEGKNGNGISAAQSSDSPYKHPRVPKFGSWENDDGIPYTIYFENARNGRTGQTMLNPNDPEEILVGPSPKSREPNDQSPSGLVDNDRADRVEKEPSLYAESLSDYSAGAAGTESSYQHHIPSVPVLNEMLKGSTRPTTALENKFNRPPPHDQAKGPWSEPDRGAAIPKFGLWNEDNSEPEEDYTTIFNTDRAPEKKQNGERTQAQVEKRNGERAQGREEKLNGEMTRAREKMQNGERIQARAEVKGSASPSNDIKPKQEPIKKTKVRCFRWFIK